MKYKFILFIALVSNLAFADIEPASWSKPQFKEFKTTMVDVTKDVRQFFKENPDIIADLFGGEAYNFKEFSKDLFKKAIKDTKKTIEGLKDYYLNDIPLTPASDEEAFQRMCQSPRICSAIQYLIARSIVEHTEDSPNSKVNYYFAKSLDGLHNYVVALPKGVPPNEQNMKIHGIIIDPWPSQSSDSQDFLIQGNDPYYQDGIIDREKISRENLIHIYGVDPLTHEPPPPTPQVECLHPNSGEPIFVGTRIAAYITKGTTPNADFSDALYAGFVGSECAFLADSQPFYNAAYPVLLENRDKGYHSYLFVKIEPGNPVSVYTPYSLHILF